MQHHRDNSGSAVWREWHERRQEARETENDEELFDDIEQEKYDLDTARIDGSDNPDNFTTEPYGDDEKPHDIREDPRY